MSSSTLFPITFEQTQKWKVSTIKIDLPFTYDDLIVELENEVWVNPGIINNLSNDNWANTRYKVMSPKPEHKYMQQLDQFFKSDELKTVFINWLYNSDSSFQYDWEWNPEEMAQHTILHGEFSKDTPGFYNVIHTDYRKLVATGIVYWANGDDPRLSSTFYDDPEGKINPMRIPTSFGGGWVHGNGNNTYHDGRNETDKMRYSTLIGLTLNITPLSRTL